MYKSLLALIILCVLSTQTKAQLANLTEPIGKSRQQIKFAMKGFKSYGYDGTIHTQFENYSYYPQYFISFFYKNDVCILVKITQISKQNFNIDKEVRAWLTSRYYKATQNGVWVRSLNNVKVNHLFRAQKKDAKTWILY